MWPPTSRKREFVSAKPYFETIHVHVTCSIIASGLLLPQSALYGLSLFFTMSIAETSKQRSEAYQNNNLARVVIEEPIKAIAE